MAPQYKLTYFDARGRGEPIRLMLNFAKVPFEDVRIERADWPTFKETTPWGQMPILEVDGAVLAQTNTIARYLAKKHGLAGETDFDQAKCDEYLDAQSDLLQEASKWFRESDEGKKAELRITLRDEVIPRFFSKFDAIIKKNGNGLLVGKKITFVDIFSANMVGQFSGFMADLDMNKFPELKKHSEMINSQPNIKEWIDKRPQSAF